VNTTPHQCRTFLCKRHNTAPKIFLFSGPFCALTMCDLSPCLYGTCVLTPGSFKCNCQPGYRGPNCEVKHRPCLDNPCEGRGECFERPGGEGFNCRCHAWWEGQSLLNKFPFPFQLHAVANIKLIAFDVYYLVSVYCLFHFSTEPNEIGK
jgi:EGF-like domain